MIFYSKKASPRLEYVVSHIFENILGLKIEFTSDIQNWKDSSHPIKIYYGTEKPKEGIFLEQKSDILFHEGVDENEFNDFAKNPTQDALVLSFLLLTRYQEYLDFLPDMHGRFPYERDKIFQKLNVEEAWIDEFALKMKNEFLSLNKSIQFPKNAFQTLCTVDIDRIWRYKETPKWILFFKKMKSFLKGSESTFQSLQQFEQNGQDPYDTFSFMNKICEDHHIPLQYFILLADKSKKYDNNIAPSNESQKAFLYNLSNKFNLGIHPSYQSQNEYQAVRQEKENLEKIIQKPVSQSRQHYIRLRFPDTYKALMDAGIKEDYSMGFPDQIGFRAGTSYVHNWFDLKNNTVTEFKLFPFCIMDVSLKKYLLLSPEEAIQKALEIKKKVKRYGGIFIPIFHNQNLTEEGDWKEWRKVFVEIIKN